MNAEVTLKVKNVIINSYIQPISIEDMFFAMFHYIKERKGVEIEQQLRVHGFEQQQQLIVAFEYSRLWFESELNLIKIFNRKGELISMTFGSDSVSEGDAKGTLP